MRPFPVLLPCLLLLAISCAHGEQKSHSLKGPAGPEASAAPMPTPAAKARFEDADGDSIPDAQDGCPLDAGDASGAQCPAKWGYFFLRVINGQRLPVRAALSFQPSVNKMVVSDDGYAGVLRPGTYELRVEAPGFTPANVTFEVLAEEKALVEVELQNTPGGSR